MNAEIFRRFMFAIVRGAADPPGRFRCRALINKSLVRRRLLAESERAVHGIRFLNPDRAIL